MSHGFKDDDHIRVELKRMVENFRLRMLKVLDDTETKIASYPDKPANMTGQLKRISDDAERAKARLTLTVRQMNDFIDRR